MLAQLNSASRIPFWGIQPGEPISLGCFRDKFLVPESEGTEARWGNDLRTRVAGYSLKMREAASMSSGENTNRDFFSLGKADP